MERSATAFLGTSERSLSVSKIVEAPAARVLQALGTVWRLPPYSLELRASTGGHPLDGGVLVFDLPGAVGVMDTTGINTTWYATRHTLEAAQLQVTLKPVTGRGNATEVTVFCDLRPGIRRNVLAASWMGGGFGGFGSILAAAIAAKKALLITMFTVTVPAAVTGLAITGATIWAYRAAYRYGISKARKEITKALDAIEGGIQSEALFGALAPPWRDNVIEDPMRRGGGRT
jgi:eukaryotic-like serine/threonine-protein kinase